MGEKKPLSEARKRANKKWNDANYNIKYDHIHLVIPKGRKETLDRSAKEQDKSLNGYINDVLADSVGMTEEEWKS